MAQKKHIYLCATRPGRSIVFPDHYKFLYSLSDNKSVFTHSHIQHCWQRLPCKVAPAGQANVQLYTNSQTMQEPPGAMLGSVFCQDDQGPR